MSYVSPTEVEGRYYYDSFLVPAIDGVNKNLIFANEKRDVALAEYPSEFSHNRSWNLVGNPFPSFYDIRFMEFSAPITVWNISNQAYEAYSPLDDDYILSPMESFFVQRPIDTDHVGFPTEGRQTDFTVRTLSAAPQMKAKAMQNREVFNLTLAGSANTDRTRFVINPMASAEYDMATDAGKFEAVDKKMAQLYTIEDGVNMAINERPLGNGTVALGAYFGEDGNYTLALNTAAASRVTLVDKLLGKTVDLSGADYTFYADAGTANDRFELKIGAATGIMDINAGGKNAISAGNGNISVRLASDANIAVYTADGKTVGMMKGSSANFEVAPGLYIVTVDGSSYKVSVNR